METQTPTHDVIPADLSLLWLELTNLCNEQCVHCYNSSGPTRRTERDLDREQWVRLIDEAAALGTRVVKFIGGEPTVVPFLAELIECAAGHGMQVEVSTNGTLLSDALIDCFVRNRVRVSISLYADEPMMHDAITRSPGSHARTLRGMRRLQTAGVPFSVGVVAMEQNAERVPVTIDFAREHGAAEVGVDRVRGFGRGAEALRRADGDLSELCGQCWKGKLCIGPDGGAFPCIMARGCPVGSVKSDTLAAIVASAELAKVRGRIRAEVPSTGHQLACFPGSCYPTDACWPSNCHPSECYPVKQCNPDTSCYPTSCNPTSSCWPTSRG